MIKGAASPDRLHLAADACETQVQKVRVGPVSEPRGDECPGYFLHRERDRSDRMRVHGVDGALTKRCAEVGELPLRGVKPGRQRERA